MNEYLEASSHFEIKYATITMYAFTLQLNFQLYINYQLDALIIIYS